MSNILPFKSGSEYLSLKFSISDGHPGKVENVEWVWPGLADRLKKSAKDQFTLAQFKALSPDQQLRRKKSGYFVGAQFRGGHRKKENMERRTLLTFDLDKCSPEILAALQAGTSGLGNTEYVLYSTRQHQLPDNIRIRIVMPLPAPLDPDKFGPLMRILAKRLDPTMIAVDAVSFRETQLMYWPSHCADVTPLYHHHRGALLEPDDILEEFGEWKDYAKLPRTAKESDLRRPEEKMQNPLTKRGIVGAVCRTMTIQEGIERYLSDIYRPSEYVDGLPSRYTYVPGTTANGCIVYDEGRAFYSHQGSDPAGGRALNLYDLLMIHLYGDLDKNTEAGVPVQETKAYAKMKGFILEDNPEVKAAYNREQFTQDELDDIAEVDLDAAYVETPDPDLDGPSETAATTDSTGRPLPPPDPMAWTADLDMTEDGQYKGSLANVILFLSHAPSIRKRLAYDEFQAEHVVLKPIVHKELEVLIEGRTKADPIGRFSENHAAAIRQILETKRTRGGYGIRVSDRDMDAARLIVSNKNKVHPIKDYLGGLKWDGVKRIDQLWIKACHTPDNLYYRETATLWMTAAVARIYEPGCKFDYCPIIEGPQGLFKSTLLVTIGGIRYTTEMAHDFEDPGRFVESTNGFWIVEIPELVQFRRSEVQAIKNLITIQGVTVRLAYDRYKRYYARQFVMAGTTNDDHYLRDPTGNRRIWPIPCGAGQIDIAWVLENRDQLWAEATSNYREMRRQTNGDMLPLYLRSDFSRSFAAALQESRMVDDGAEGLAGQIQVWLDLAVPAAMAEPGAQPGNEDLTEDPDLAGIVLRTKTCGQEIWERGLSRRLDQYGPQQAQIVQNAMAKIKGWSRGHKLTCGVYGRQRAYIRTPKS